MKLGFYPYNIAPPNSMNKSKLTLTFLHINTWAVLTSVIIQGTVLYFGMNTANELALLPGFH